VAHRLTGIALSRARHRCRSTLALGCRARGNVRRAGGRLYLSLGALVVASVVAVIAVATGGTASATIAFRNDTGQACSFCHATPGTDMRLLTIEGQRFRNNGYRLLGPASPPAAAPPPSFPRPSTATSGRPSFWNHNGSIMKLVANGASRQFFYQNPRQGMVNEGVRSGTLLFEGFRNGGTYSGTAFIFQRRCGSFGYAVSGTVSADERMVVMQGMAPRVNGNCQVVGSRPDELVFELQ
jgi:hypothetical protein